jgi:hypothetical protein
MGPTESLFRLFCEPTVLCERILSFQAACAADDVSRAPKERRTVFLGAECDANPLRPPNRTSCGVSSCTSKTGDESPPSVGHSAHHVAVERSAVQ